MYVVGLVMLLVIWWLLCGLIVFDCIFVLDMLLVIVIVELMLFGMYFNLLIYFEVVLIIVMFGFGSIVVLSKFVLCWDIVE